MALGDKLVNLDDLKAVHGNLKSAISSPTPVWTVGSLVNSSGTVITEGSYAVRSAITQIMPVHPGDLIDNSAMLTKDADNHAFTLYACYYTNGVFDSRNEIMTASNRKRTIPSGIDGLRFSFTISTIDMTETIIADYINFELYTKSTPYSEYIDLLYKGNKPGNDPAIMSYFKNRSSLTSVLDMPVWSWIQGAGSVISALLPNFDYSLRTSVTYIVECRSLTSPWTVDTVRLYRVYTPTSYDEYYVGYKRSDSASFVWTDAKETEKSNVNYIKTVSDADTPGMFVYTDFDGSPKYWMSDGSLSNSELEHTQYFRIIPNGKCYVSYVVGQSCQGAWFDKNGEWIAPLLDTDMSNYSYKNPNCGSGAAGTYVTIKEFTAPENAHWLSLNIARGDNLYRSYLASKPVCPHSGTGNIVAGKNDAAYQNKKNKKLCVIGPSTAMIGRRYISDLEQYLCGWQEYIAPWYSLCESYGYSGGAMGYMEGIPNVEVTYESVYHGIVIEETDLSGYDDYIIMADVNSIATTGIGDWGTVPEAPQDVTTYMGGLRGIVEYILGQNPLANIYLMTMIGPKNYFGATYITYRNNILEINEKTRDMALKLHLRLIDLAADCGYTSTSTYDTNDPTAGYTYDGTHYNQQGSEIVGKAVRKAIIGI